MILVSSEHAFPHRLQDPRLGFNLQNFKQYIYAGEVPPKEMYELLTTKWGVASNLALALIDIYGGHVYDLEDALSRLYMEKEKFRQYFDSNLSSNVHECLQWKFDKEEDNVRMREVLQQLSITGFVPLKNRGDPIAKVISANNVGGVVLSSGEIIGLRDEVFYQKDFEFGIVPSKQSMRLLIAEILKMQ